MVIATRGADGAALMTQEGFYEQSPNLVEAKDTMGAGDSFIASFLTSYLGGLRGGTDFKDGPGKGITKRSEYEDVLIRISLYRAAIFSAEQCQRAGSFGYGKSIELTAEDIKLMDAFRQH